MSVYGSPLPPSYGSLGSELYSTASGTSEPSDTERDTERDIEVKNMKDPLMGRHHRTTPLKVSVAV